MRIVTSTTDKNQAFLGMRYARSSFKDHLKSQLLYQRNIQSNTSLIQADHPNIDNGQREVAYWFEVVSGVKVKIWKLLYAGGTLRYKFDLHLGNSKTSDHVPYDIPGWGLNDNKQAPFDFNLYVSLRIPLGV